MRLNHSGVRDIVQVLTAELVKVLAYVFGSRKDKLFVQLKQRREPFEMKRYYTDGWGAYKRHLLVASDEMRKTICFSTTAQMHEVVIGLFINRCKFGLPV